MLLEHRLQSFVLVVSDEVQHPSVQVLLGHRVAVHLLDVAAGCQL